MKFKLKVNLKNSEVNQKCIKVTSVDLEVVEVDLKNAQNDLDDLQTFAFAVDLTSSVDLNKLEADLK